MKMMTTKLLIWVNIKLIEQYPPDENTPKNYVDITEIIVPTERDKQQLLAAFKYIHDNKIIDSNYYAVNTLMHMYEVPDRIRVQAS